MELSVIIPTYNGLKLLENNLPSLFNELRSVKNSEVIVIDNNSADGTAEFIDKNYPSIRYFKLNSNFGFSGAVNAGSQNAQGKYLLILNNDCIFENNSLSKLFKFLKENTNYIATQPVLYKPNKAIENIGYIVDLRKAKAREVRDTSHNFGRSTKDIFSIHYVYGLSAACLLIRKDVFSEIGAFDQSFHSYLEDVDLFLRLVKKGYHFRPCLQASVIHAHMSTSSKMKGYKEWHDLTNWIRIVIKNYPKGYLVRHFPSLFVERLRNFSGYIKHLISRI